MDITLLRVAVRSEGAFGVLLQRGLPFGVSLERTYDPANLVKIPEGFWECRPTVFRAGKPQPYPTFEVQVPGHSRLLFHRGNLERDTDGCVLVGESFAEIQGLSGIGQSSAGFAEFIDRAGTMPFTLEVRRA